MKNIDRTKTPELADVADEFNRELNNLSTKSFGGQTIANITLKVGEEVEIPHSLKVTPKYRIILRQSADVTITDGDTAWDDKKIFLKAVSSVTSGSATVTWPTTSQPDVNGTPFSVGGTIVAPLRRCNVGGQALNLWAIAQWSGTPPFFNANAEGVVLPNNVSINFSGATSVDTVIVSILLLKE